MAGPSLVERDIERLEFFYARSVDLAIGGTAVGTGSELASRVRRTSGEEDRRADRFAVQVAPQQVRGAIGS